MERSTIWIFKIDGFESKESYKLCYTSNEAHGSRQSKHLHVTCFDDPDICVVVCAHNLFHRIISKIFHGDNKINSVNYNHGITISRRFMIDVQLSVFVVYMKFTAGVIKFKESVGHLIAAISYFIGFWWGLRWNEKSHQSPMGFCNLRDN